MASYKQSCNCFDAVVQPKDLYMAAHYQVFEKRRSQRRQFLTDIIALRNSIYTKKSLGFTQASEYVSAVQWLVSWEVEDEQYRYHHPSKTTEEVCVSPGTTSRLQPFFKYMQHLVDIVGGRIVTSLSTTVSQVDGFSSVAVGVSHAILEGFVRFPFKSSSREAKSTDANVVAAYNTLSNITPAQVDTLSAAIRGVMGTSLVELVGSLPDGLPPCCASGRSTPRCRLILSNTSQFTRSSRRRSPSGTSTTKREPSPVTC